MLNIAIATAVEILIPIFANVIIGLASVFIIALDAYVAALGNF
jgi:hypothetical protein